MRTTVTLDDDVLEAAKAQASGKQLGAVLSQLARRVGFIRLSSNPAYTTNAVSPHDAAALLQQWTRLKSHHFWPSPAADDSSIYARAVGHQQVNDAWLVEVARRNSGRLITLDSRLPAHATKTDMVEVIKT